MSAQSEATRGNERRATLGSESTTTTGSPNGQRRERFFAHRIRMFNRPRRANRVETWLAGRAPRAVKHGKLGSETWKIVHSVAPTGRPY